MKKIILMIVGIVVANALFAHHGPPGRSMHNSSGYGPRIYHAPPPPPRHHHHHSSKAFWSGVGVGLVGSLIAPPTTVVASPIVVSRPQRVWIPPVYGERPIYRAGIYVGSERYIITPVYWQMTY